MAVIGPALEMPVDREGPQSENGRRQYMRKFVVETNSAYDDPGVVLGAPLLPQLYDAYVTLSGIQDDAARVVYLDPKQAPKSRLVWYVDVLYDTEFDRLDNPLLEPPQITHESETYQLPLPGSYNQSTSSGSSGTTFQFQSGILNSAGDPYDPPPTIEQSRPIVRFTRNQSFFTLDFKVRFENSVNGDVWNGLAARQAWLKSIQAELLVQRSTSRLRPDVTYWRVSYLFALKRETWDLQLLDYGPRYRKISGGTPVPFGANDVPKIGLLNNTTAPNSGTFDGEKKGPSALAAYNRFRVMKEEAFSELNINLLLGLSQLKQRKR